jgi:hypothetical protein
MFRKKPITQKGFERKIQFWTIAVTLIVAVIGSLTAIGVAYLNRPKTEYIMSPDDQLEVNKLSAQINLLSRRYFAAQDRTEQEKLGSELRVLAETEATIMRRYNPNYRPRWPLPGPEDQFKSRPLMPYIGLTALLMMMVGISAHYALRRILNNKYRKQLLYTYIIDAVRRRNSWGATTSEINDDIREAHPHYKPDEIENALWELDADHKIQINGSQCSLIPSDGF